MGQITLIGASNSQIVTVEDGALLGKLYGDWEYAIADGEAYVWTNSAIDGYDYTAKDTVLAVENNSTTKDLYIQRVVINGDTASQWVMFVDTQADPSEQVVTLAEQLGRIIDIDEHYLSPALRQLMGAEQ